MVRGLLVNASAASEYGTTVERSCEESCVRQIYLSVFAVVLFLTTLCEQPHKSCGEGASCVVHSKSPRPARPVLDPALCTAQVC